MAVRRAIHRPLQNLQALGVSARVQDLLTFSSWDPANFDPDNSAEVATYRSLVRVCREVREDLADFTIHPLAVVWRERLDQELRKVNKVHKESYPKQADRREQRVEGELPGTPSLLKSSCRWSWTSSTTSSSCT